MLRWLLFHFSVLSTIDFPLKSLRTSPLISLPPPHHAFTHALSHAHVLLLGQFLHPGHHQASFCLTDWCYQPLSCLDQKFGHPP